MVIKTLRLFSEHSDFFLATVAPLPALESAWVLCKGKGQLGSCYNGSQVPWPSSLSLPARRRGPPDRELGLDTQMLANARHPCNLFHHQNIGPGVRSWPFSQLPGNLNPKESALAILSRISLLRKLLSVSSTCPVLVALFSAKS